MGLSASRSALEAHDQSTLEQAQVSANGPHLFDVTINNKGGEADPLSSASAVSSTTLLIIGGLILLLIAYCIHEMEACLGCCHPCLQPFYNKEREQPLAPQQQQPQLPPLPQYCECCRLRDMEAAHR